MAADFADFSFIFAAFMRKCLLILPLLIAYSVLFAHTAIPHHHHLLSGQEPKHDDHDHDSDDSLSSAFEYFQHEQGKPELVFTSQANNFDYVKKKFTHDLFFVINRFIELRRLPPLISPVEKHFHFTPSLLFDSDLLRGPPSL